MSGMEVFQDSNERHRLTVQNRLLKQYERPVLSRLISGRTGLRVLDVGCNDGSKTAEWFSCGNVERVVGLEYHEELAAEARRCHGNGKFVFMPCDVESEDFPERLCRAMEQWKIEAFDLLYLSFVLMHLENPALLLKKLRRFLAPGGQIIVVEANDSASRLEPDPHCLLKGFLDILSCDPYGGDRQCGKTVPELLKKSGYGNISVESMTVDAREGEVRKKHDIFESFFSYLPQDLAVLRQKEADDSRLRDSRKWIESNYGELRKLVLSERAAISMGISIVTASGE